MSWHVSPWVYPVWDSLSFLDLIDYFLFHVGGISTIISSKNFSYPFFFSSSSETPIIQMLVCLILSQRSLRLSSVLFILFTLFCSSEVISTILSSSSLIHFLLQIFCYWFLLELLLISVIVLFVSVCLFFNSFRSLLIDSYIFSNHNGMKLDINYKEKNCKKHRHLEIKQHDSK